MKVFTNPNARVLLSITCDVCGSKFTRKDDEPWDTYEVQEFVSISFTAGYSSVFGDENKVELDICQHCLKQKLGDFVRITEPPEVVYETQPPLTEDEVAQFDALLARVGWNVSPGKEEDKK